MVMHQTLQSSSPSNSSGISSNSSSVQIYYQCFQIFGFRSSISQFLSPQECSQCIFEHSARQIKQFLSGVFFLSDGGTSELGQLYSALSSSILCKPFSKLEGQCYFDYATYIFRAGGVGALSWVKRLCGVCKWPVVEASKRLVNRFYPQQPQFL
ncbi:hypothetical protein FGO68_gene13073 [Halteria grandinella]|uniref:Uncharacterized protein n=1 Tax=Halteria grandinella TaxID=5974 RepID=A0A8J8NVX8_HALGN|nr:hypothetical protein FGO68_gene13073 [Halteria grandinella]